MPTVHLTWIEYHGGIGFEAFEQQGAPHCPLRERPPNEARSFTFLYGCFCGCDFGAIPTALEHAKRAAHDRWSVGANAMLTSDLDQEIRNNWVGWRFD